MFVDAADEPPSTGAAARRAGLVARGRQPRPRRRPQLGRSRNAARALPRRRGPPGPRRRTRRASRGGVGSSTGTGVERRRRRRLARVASRSRAIADPPPIFGTIRPRRSWPRSSAASPRAERSRRAPQARRPPCPSSTRTRRRRTIPRTRPAPLEPGRRRGSGRSAAQTDVRPDAGTRRRWSSRRGRRRHRRPRPSRAAAPGRRDGQRRGRARGTDAGAAAAPTYPEWDVHRSRYRPDWCTVVEMRRAGRRRRRRWPCPTADPARPLARLGIGLEPLPAAAAGRRHRHRRRRRGAGRRAGRLSPHDDVYIESLRRRRDLAVLVLLDVSGRPANRAAGTPVHEHQRSAAAALTDRAARARRPGRALRLQLPGSRRGAAACG